MIDALKTILAALEEGTGFKPVPFSVDAKDCPALVFEFYRTQDNGAVAQYRLMLRCIAPTLFEAMQMEEKAVEAITTLGDEPLGEVLSIAANGGGMLKDQESGTTQLITYFQIIDRS